MNCCGEGGMVKSAKQVKKREERLEEGEGVCLCVCEVRLRTSFADE